MQVGKNQQEIHILANYDAFILNGLFSAQFYDDFVQIF